MKDYSDLRILVVEDDPDHAQLLTHRLRREFAADLTHFATATAALAVLEQFSFDLILLDYSLPDLNGLELLRRCRAAHPEVPVLMITGQGDERIAVQAMKLGASDYLVKAKDYCAAVPHAIRRTLEKSALQRRLGETESRYQRLVQNALMGIFQAAPEGRFLMANEALVKMLGYNSEEELLSVDIRQDLFLNPEEFDELGRKVAEREDGCEAVYTLRKKDGTPIVVKKSARAVRDAEGRLSHLEGFMQDITQQQRAESESRRLANFPKLSPHFILELNEWGGVRYFNPATAEFLQSCGKTTEEVYVILPPDLADLCRDMLAAAATAPVLHREVHVEGRIIFYEFHAIADERIIHAHGLDVTEQRELEQQLQQAQQLESIGRLAGGIAHDFNNLLMGIIGYASLIKDELGAQDRHYNDICEIENAAQRASEITRQLLLYSRRAAGQPVEVNLNDVIAVALDALSHGLPPGVRLRQELGDGLPAVLLDPMQFHQVLSNLIDNACEAMSQEGEVVLQTYFSERQESDVLTQTPEKSGRFVVVALRDSGVGIAAENLQLIFEPFYSTKHVGKGSGLGLATAYGIVRTHGGVIHVKSEPGKGTEFRLYFPAV